MSRVPSIEAEGITRACTMVPVIRKNARATQTQESSSRTRRSRKVLDSTAGEWLGPSGTTESRPAERSALATGVPEPALVKLSFTVFSFGFRDRNLFAASGGRYANLELHIFGHVDAGVAGSTEAASGIADGAAQAFEREIADRIGVEEKANLFERASGACEIGAAAFGQAWADAGSVRGKQFLARGGIHAVIAGRNRRRTTDAHMHLRGTRFAHHAHDLAAGGATNDGIVDQHDALAFEQGAHGIKLQPDAEIADGLLGLDKCAAHIVAANQAHAKGQSGFERVADGRGHAGIRHGHDEIGVGGLFASQQAAEHLPAAIDRPAEDQAIGTREIDVFENAKLMLLLRSESQRFDATAGDAYEFAGLDLADVLRA